MKTTFAQTGPHAVLRNLGLLATNTDIFPLFRQASILVNNSENQLISIAMIDDILKAERLVIESDARAGQEPGGAWTLHLGRTHQERTQKGANISNIFL